MPDSRPDDAEISHKHAALRERLRVVTDLATRMTSSLDVDSLLAMVLTEARRLTSSDAGSLYVKEADQLVFKLAQNDSLPDSGQAVKEFSFPIDHGSLAGLCALSKSTLNIPDVQNHASYDRATAEKIGYAVHTMLVVPMVDHRKQVMGVLQLMNQTQPDGRITPYDDDTTEISEVLAAHAGTAIEVARLYQQVQGLVEAMVIYTAKAIDARDPATAGHSSRVANYALKLADFHGGFSKEELKEIRYAGLFHDLGKIGVPEAILTKRNKLSEAGLETVKERIESAKRSHEVEALREGLTPDRERALEQRFAQLDDIWQFIDRINVPRPLSDEDVSRLDAIVADAAFTATDGERRPLLTPAEHEALRVRKGNLTDGERAIMNSHVTMSHKIIKRFPFTPELARVPEFVIMHHEKIDGTGYPHGLKGEAIPLQARILAIVDALDALTAQDRPYKKPIPIDKSLMILNEEADSGFWDKRLVGLLEKAIDTSFIKLRPHPDDESLTPPATAPPGSVESE